MTVVRLEFTRPAVSGPDLPGKGLVEFRPTKRREAGPIVELPGKVNVRLGAAYIVGGTEVYPATPGVAYVDLEPTTVDWAWRAHEQFDQGITRYVFVPEDPEPGDFWIDYPDLVDIDPDTFTPDPDPPAAWVAAAADLQAQIDSISVGSFYYRHVQAIPSSEWVVAHNLGTEPDVALIIGDELGDTDTEYLDADTVRLVFPTPQTGLAVFS